ncbi:dNTP triphosphohydrolase [Clostridium estertheticum]|uniref:deoxyguanosinetriphosphate triphosphohydrolase family protein n=1 Tax=Clostridium estertheticum TaxID=238834 RepID=UPI001C0C2D8E|nr:dNTP triphosphohydrolase [Clostridium estertheticum]MBU3176294.1 dNTP triphosphohydrolase [Clostridium estertheticum]
MEDIKEIIKFRDEKMQMYAQHDNKSDRKVLNIDNKDDEYGSMFVRNEFSKDRDRIKFSRAFRRLEHKAQIYSHEKGDHFRTRLTHTLEVSQIARSLARNLNLNEDLVEAISIGHDIGHTPFGHQGERTLDNIMSGKDDLSGKIKFNINYGGFKHNFHSLKILDQLEVKYKGVKGMNLTWQVLEGILKHTRIKRHTNCKNCGGCWNIDKVVKDKDFLKEYLRYNFSVTLEGQIVAIADEIAQRQHDVDDGLRDIDLKLNFKEVATYLIAEFKDIIIEENAYTKNLERLIASINDITEVSRIEREELFKVNVLVRNLINFFIIDVTFNSLIVMKENVCNYNFEQNEKNLFDKKYIWFSPVGEKVNIIIEKYIKTKILNSYNVNRFDGKSIYIIRQLFKAYYTNPRQMPEYVLVGLSKKIEAVSDTLHNIQFAGGTEVKDINFTGSKPEEIEKSLKLLKLEIPLSELDINQQLKSKMEDIKNKVMIEDKLKHINNESKENLNKEEIYIKAMLELHYAYLSVICDYIAGMTDNYASHEFKKLYLAD